MDGNYTDGRHPDSVAFTTDIRDDLARRDLTINAMAYSPATGIIDPFGGQEDLKNEIIRCVGAPHKRFSEDALRLMRTIRFAAVLGFTVEPKRCAPCTTCMKRSAASQKSAFSRSF